MVVEEEIQEEEEEVVVEVEEAASGHQDLEGLGGSKVGIYSNSLEGKPILCNFLQVCARL